MVQSLLVKQILNNAEAIKNEFNSDALYASHIAVAFEDFCATQYTGFSFRDNEAIIARFEEERVRYLFSETLRLHSFFRKALGMQSRHSVSEEEFDINSCIPFMELRDTVFLTADILLLCTLKSLKSPYSKILKAEINDEAVSDLFKIADESIFDYVIEKIDNISNSLKEKAQRARDIRDWKPAPKFTEPEELSEIFFEKIKKKKTGNITTLTFPGFFGTSDLKISIHKVGEIYYAHDNGCAIKNLSKRLTDKEKRERALNKICNSCWLDKSRVTGSFASPGYFLSYLQKLVLVAHADLYYTRATRQLYQKEKGYTYMNERLAEAFDEQELLNALKKNIGFGYDINEGLYFWLDASYAFSSTKPAFLIECPDSRKIRISDKRKGKFEGEILEAFYWENNNISLHSRFVSKIAARFDADFDGENFYLTDKKEQPVRAMFKFFNLSILLSHFGHDISV